MEAAIALDPRKIIVNSKSKNKEDVIKELTHLFFEYGDISSENDFLSDVYEREKEGPTGIGDLVAIPHGKGTSVIKPSIAIATLSNEIPWESLDDSGARIVILFAVTNDGEGSREHLKLLSEFAKKLGNEIVLEKLTKANTVSEIISAFK
ncbi:PTS fructose transporter subunit IIA [Oenococcus oeni]|uniref:PTS fructose transporter subunit IIA n=1 Tax=Oenococcus oeni TaxID=1247 RepID=A0A6N4A6P4_OENOE|nr:fructose PTS transporter subunit IIA [Oenococcus oeni]OIM20771.1 PTS fructose transporter subunit IIA [Oenococcus oeni]